MSLQLVHTLLKQQASLNMCAVRDARKGGCISRGHSGARGQRQGVAALSLAAEASEPLYMLPLGPVVLAGPGQCTTGLGQGTHGSDAQPPQPTCANNTAACASSLQGVPMCHSHALLTALSMHNALRGLCRLGAPHQRQRIRLHAPPDERLLAVQCGRRACRRSPSIAPGPSNAPHGHVAQQPAALTPSAAATRVAAAD